jgi:hypothetical protein
MLSDEQNKRQVQNFNSALEPLSKERKTISSLSSHADVSTLFYASD